jgi:hypothetical protein
MNMDKTIAIWASKTPRTWTFGVDRSLKWLQPGQTTLNLGFPIRFEMAQQEKNAKVIQQIRLKLGQWVNKPLSMVARVLVTNQVVIASIWYIASCADLSRSILAKAKTMVRNFIWNGHAGDTYKTARVAWDSTVLPGLSVRPSVRHVR